LDNVADDIDGGKVASGAADKLDDSGNVKWFRRVLKVKGLRDGEVAGKIVGSVFGVAIALFFVVMFLGFVFLTIGNPNPPQYDLLLGVLVLAVAAMVVMVLAGAVGGGVAGVIACWALKRKDRWHKIASWFAGAVGGVAGVALCLLIIYTIIMTGTGGD
jgi:hypothetical protein